MEELRQGINESFHSLDVDLLNLNFVKSARVVEGIRSCQ